MELRERLAETKYWRSCSTFGAEAVVGWSVLVLGEAGGDGEGAGEESEEESSEFIERSRVLGDMIQINLPNIVP